MAENKGSEPSIAKEAVLVKSVELPSQTPTVRGYDFNDGVDYDQLFASYIKSGFQATNFGKAVEEINKMVDIYTSLKAILSKNNGFFPNSKLARLPTDSIGRRGQRYL